MIKLAILGFIASWFVLRKLFRNRRSVMKILARVYGLCMLLIVVAITIAAFGPQRYQVHIDSLDRTRISGETSVFAWQTNVFLPIEQLAKPQLLDKELDVIGNVPPTTLERLSSQYPYKPAPLYLSVALYAAAIVFFWLMYHGTRHKEIVSRYTSAREDDTMRGYDEYTQWATKNVVRSLHSRKYRKLAAEYRQSVATRAVLKLNMFQEAFKNVKREAQFLDILDEIHTAGHNELAIDVRYNGNNLSKFELSSFYEPYENAPVLPNNILSDMLTNRESKFQQLVNDAFRVMKEVEFGAMIWGPMRYVEKHTAYLPPAIEYAEYALSKTLKEALTTRINQYFSPQLLKVVSPVESNGKVSLMVEFNCFADSANHYVHPSYGWNRERTAGLRAGAGAKYILRDGKLLDGANAAYFNLGFLLDWKLVIDGSTVKAGQIIATPNDRQMIGSRQKEEKVDVGKGTDPVNLAEVQASKEAVENDYFERSAISATESFISQLMGITLNEVNKGQSHLSPKLLKKSAETIKTMDTVTESIETSLREESLSELLNTSSKELYHANKEMVDQYVYSLIETSGEVDNIRYLIENYADWLPSDSLIEEILNGVAELAEEV